MSQTGKQSALACWDILCTALGVSLSLSNDLDLTSHDYIRLYLKHEDPEIPQFGLCLRPEVVCINGQMSLVLLGESDLCLVVSCDLTTKVLTVLIVQGRESGLFSHNVKSKLPKNLSLYQIYDKVKVVSAIYLKGSDWTPLVVK